MLVPQELLHQSHQLGNRILQNTLPSPQSDFMGGYTSQSTPAPLPQASPSSVNMRQVNSGYLLQNNGYQVDPYSNMMNSGASEGSIASQSSDGPGNKGFNYSNMDNCFVYITPLISVHIEAIDNHPPSFVKVGNELKLITEFKLAFCGVKSEMPLEIHERRMTKVTVPRLHFSETTMNNQRKNGRPNPDQKYFLLVVRLIACTADGLDPVVQAYQSEKVIVRASNPGQFEPPDSDVAWQKNGSTLFYNSGSVAIGMDRAMAPLTVGGDIYCSGVVHRPSDRRVKEEIHEGKNLIAMSTLYVLDWHSRTFGYHRRQTAVIATTASPEKAGNIGNIIQVNKDLWIPPSQPKAPPLAGVCERKHCQTYCCADRHKYDVHDDNKEPIMYYRYCDLKVVVSTVVRFTNGGAESYPVHVFFSLSQQHTALLPRDRTTRPTLSSRSPLASGVNIEILSLNVTLRDFDQKACSFDQDPIKTDVSKRPISRKVMRT
uniref:NDT80 domain-containing protein n=1 Tax=Parascaris equorum TaxID=6256 RepID=A0A914RZC5_PAREQ